MERENKDIIRLLLHSMYVHCYQVKFCKETFRGIEFDSRADSLDSRWKLEQDEGQQIYVSSKNPTGPRTGSELPVRST